MGKRDRVERFVSCRMTIIIRGINLFKKKELASIKPKLIKTQLEN